MKALRRARTLSDLQRFSFKSQRPLWFRCQESVIAKRGCTAKKVKPQNPSSSPNPFKTQVENDLPVLQVISLASLSFIYASTSIDLPVPVRSSHPPSRRIGPPAPDLPQPDSANSFAGRYLHFNPNHARYLQVPPPANPF